MDISKRLTEERAKGENDKQIGGCVRSRAPEACSARQWMRTKDESIVFTHQIMDKLVVNNYVITTEQYKC